ncbi:ferritin-like domain-containing protein [Salinispora sp. H7-4]|uniref:ferritin-like domain-containing protein n=1 Tax=Salinispora sp. H7-4 TaxID=2748321 RepID=UPI0015D38957|nr:ferritin-like domain-containing protein [Salinispora sp. H7-4]NYT95660.1 ferritin-like domain-containing protein [Salinispora sp. H7-4]
MSFVVPTQVDTTLNWDYEATDPRLMALYERAKSAQWKVSDVDWTVDVPFGEPLPDDSAFAMAAFADSPLAARGRPAWDDFRWEFQSWMVSQFLHGEQAALVVAARLVAAVPDLDSKFCAATQVVDEARHVEVFARYLREKIPEPYEVSPPLRELLTDILSDPRWDVTALGMQIMVEAIAMASFRLSNSSFHDPLIKNLTRLVARDEARHVTFGVLSLRGLYDQLTTAERAEREELVLDAASLIRQRFLLGDIWQRLEVDRAEGVSFAASHDLMIMYRQAVFSRVAAALGQIGLMTHRVRVGLDKLGLLRFAGERLRVREGR